MSGVLVVMEQRAGAWHRMSWETLAAGQQLAAQTGLKVYGAVVGQGIGALAEELARKKLDHVHAVEHPLLATYTADGFTAALEQLIRKFNPSIVLFPHTYQVRDFAPKLATRFNQVLVSDAVGFRVESNTPIFGRCVRGQSSLPPRARRCTKEALLTCVQWRISASMRSAG